MSSQSLQKIPSELHAGEKNTDVCFFFSSFPFWFWGGWRHRKVCEAAVGSCFSCQVRAGGGMEHRKVMENTTGNHRRVWGSVLQPGNGLQRMRLQNCIHNSQTSPWSPWFSKVILHLDFRWMWQVVLDRKQQLKERFFLSVEPHQCRYWHHAPLIKRPKRKIEQSMP